MDTARLKQLGLEVRGEGEGLEATLVLPEPLKSAQLTEHGLAPQE